MKRVLALLPHPDDEVFCAGLLASAVDQGCSVASVYVTTGQRGTLGPEPEATVGRVRREEAEASARTLGLEEVVFLEYCDGALGQLPTGSLTAALAREIRRFRADTVVTLDPQVWDEHPDHRAVAIAASDAMQFAHLPLFWPEHREEGLPLQLVAERFLFAKTPEPSRINRVVDIGKHLETKLVALAAHRSQLAFLIDELVMQLELAEVDVTGLPWNLHDPIERAEMVKWALRRQARLAARGQPGIRFGEAFHYQRFSPMVDELVTATRRLGWVVRLLRAVGLGRPLRRLLSGRGSSAANGKRN